MIVQCTTTNTQNIQNHNFMLAKEFISQEQTFDKETPGIKTEIFEFAKKCLSDIEYWER